MAQRVARAAGRGHGAVVGVEGLRVGPWEVELTRKRIKRAYLRLDDVAGPVRVSAPARMPIAQIVAFVEKNAAWIEQRRAVLAAAAPASPRRGHIAADATVLVWGDPRPLEEVAPRAARILAGPAGVLDRAAVAAAWKDCPDDVAARVEKGVCACLRDQLAARAEPLVRAYEPQMGVDVRELRYRDMQTRWGSCNVREHRVWLALSLAHLDPACLELIVVHELCHLHETGHGPRFKALMTRYLPDWRQREALLKQVARGR